ncbi:GNAT family N-acetyltransferase [Halobaculum sp. WSA2]|uniref:GNAT family N-acetyltransferase n=1 Tax=Halobaculum saliterrae TaxID=2073113 RepID=A0A6B0SVK3_9EURY|nr:GNAT family N-acetyltransferase [Halobaculum saliterrae]MXR42657.1 GNAT family N-acetyltransferase [Halobaculum saliterrae]
MELTENLTFSHTDRRDLYEFVEEHGTVHEREARRALNLDRTAFGHHATVLVRDGYLDWEEDHLSVAYEDNGATEHTADGLEYVVRIATQRDLSGLVGVIRQVAGEGTYIEAETVADVIEHDEVVLRHNELESRLFMVATVDDEVIGWVHLDLPEAEKLSHTAVLTVGILPEYRGKGIGSTLLERGESWAASHGFEKLYNSIPATNDGAVAFLTDHGWEREAVREGHYTIDGEYVDELMLARRLE